MADLKHIVPINASPAKVYATVATQGGMRSWWTADAQMEERIGGKAEFAFENRQLVFRMTIDRLDRGQCVVMLCLGDLPEWHNTTLRWESSSANPGGRSRCASRTAAGANSPTFALAAIRCGET
jgi:uncharacterized protein YndB with AHSA1/START domain